MLAALLAQVITNLIRVGLELALTKRDLTEAEYRSRLAAVVLSKRHQMTDEEIEAEVRAEMDE